MTRKQFQGILRRLAAEIKHDYKDSNLADSIRTDRVFDNKVDEFLINLEDAADRIDLKFLKNEALQDQLESYLEQTEYPILTFAKAGDRIKPVVIHYRGGTDLYAWIFDDQGYEIEMDEIGAHNLLTNELIQNENGKVYYAIPLPNHPIVSEGENTLDKIQGPISRLMRLLSAEKKDIGYVYIYAVVISIITLVLPVGIQAIIELIGAGVPTSSLYILIGVVLFATIFVGAMQVMQYSLVEILERRVFVRAAFELTYRIPKIRADVLTGSYPPELMNRFFDVLTLQKGMAKLLIDITGALLQILFGLILLSFYHPFFIFFSIGLIFSLVVIFYITGPKGLKTSLIESKYKYKVVHWLEEMARTLYSFKLAGHTSLPIQRMDHLLDNYLHYRKQHFRILIIQFISVVGFKSIVTGGLLIIGSILVINRQITLGQFVASEIVVILILGAVEKLIVTMSTVYDMLTAVEKIGHVTDLDLERRGGVPLPISVKEGMDITMEGVSYKYPNTSSNAIKNINTHLKPGECVGVAGFNGAGKNTFVNVLAGIMGDWTGTILLNGVPMTTINLETFHDQIAKNASTDDIFDGSILENVSMGKPNISLDDVYWALEKVELLDFVNRQKDGIMTQLLPADGNFSSSIGAKLIIARSIAERPSFLILHDILHNIDKEQKQRLLHFLSDKNNPWTLMVVSNDPTILSYTDRIIFMEDGAIRKEGTFNELNEEAFFRTCVN